MTIFQGADSFLLNNNNNKRDLFTKIPPLAEFFNVDNFYQKTFGFSDFIGKFGKLDVVMTVTVFTEHQW